MDITFVIGSFAERTGWREIVAQAFGRDPSAPTHGELRQTSVSQRLTHYPQDLIASPLRDQFLNVLATIGGATLPPPRVPDATRSSRSIPPCRHRRLASRRRRHRQLGPSAHLPRPRLPSRVGVAATDLPDIFRQPISPRSSSCLSLVAAAALGAGPCPDARSRQDG
jgi:hypothetical protein